MDRGRFCASALRSRPRSILFCPSRKTDAKCKKRNGSAPLRQPRLSGGSVPHCLKASERIPHGGARPHVAAKRLRTGEHFVSGCRPGPVLLQADPLALETAEFCKAAVLQPPVWRLPYAMRRGAFPPCTVRFNRSFPTKSCPYGMRLHPVAQNAPAVLNGLLTAGPIFCGHRTFSFLFASQSAR